MVTKSDPSTSFVPDLSSPNIIAHATSRKTTTTDVDEQLTWEANTYIALEPFTESTRSFKLALKGQGTVMRGIIKAAVKHSSIALVTSHEFNCLSSTGLNELCLASLIHCSDAAGCDGPNGITDRLQRGDLETYTKPIIKYVSCYIVFKSAVCR